MLLLGLISTLQIQTLCPAKESFILYVYYINSIDEHSKLVFHFNV